MTEPHYEESRKLKREKGSNGLFVCPCCGYATLSQYNGYIICDICFWEDDGQDDPYEDEEWGGPNSESLTQARKELLEREPLRAKINKKYFPQVRIFEIIEGKVVLKKSEKE